MANPSAWHVVHGSETVARDKLVSAFTLVQERWRDHHPGSGAITAERLTDWFLAALVEVEQRR